MSNPTVAWLAVVSGPGKGEILTLGYGANSIGRGGGDRVNLDFGDLQISRQEHATITYDPRGRKFYLQHGRGNNLTYLEQEPVLTPTQLTRNAQITLGDTILLFIPLCSADFDWQDIERESPDEPT
ncbi:MAG: hypothetical protein COC19_06505 [SAR86 cluster bacterium]|uniref:FHA domain-containing protein n=1 Tax=SAR86 cluster bacterium TaxID=2030880 RepID=A0A2A4MJ96_9GAMM|nr:MAG: hypothetical protein COC19_06505 [SAR86 cluster bacterium]